MSTAVRTRTRPAGLILAALFLAIAAFQVAATMIFPALPAISMGLGAPSADLSLSQSLFFAIGGLSAASLPLSDRVGRKAMLVGVIALGALGTILILSSESLLLFNIGRWMQAPGVIALPLAFLILRGHVSEDRYPLYLGWLSALNLGATGVDGAVAGWLTDTVGWRGIFWVGLVIAMLALGSVIVVIPGGGRARSGRTDWAGLVTLGIGVVGISVGLSQGGTWGWFAPSTVALLAIGLAFMVVFVFVERAVASPLVQVRHLASRRVLSLPLTILFGMAGFMSVFSFLAPFVAQLPTAIGGFEITATVYALATVPGTVLSFVLAPLCGAVARRVGWRPILITGVAISLVALVGITLSLHSPVMTFIFFAILTTVFAGATMTAANGLSILLSPSESPAFLPGIVSVMFSFGASFGAAIVGSIVATPSPGSFTAAFAATAALMLIAIVFALFVPKHAAAVVSRIEPVDETRGVAS